MQTVQQGGSANALKAVASEEQGGMVIYYTSGEKQESKCRDPVWAVLLVLAVVAIVAVAAVTGGDILEEALHDTGGAGVTNTNYRGFIYVMVISGLFTYGLSEISLSVMFRLGNVLIKVALLSNIVVSGLLAAFMLVSGQLFVALFCVLAFFINCIYPCCVWSRIPFATANLVTAMTTVRSNGGVTIVACLCTGAAFLWTFIWSIAFFGVYDQNENQIDDENQNQMGYATLFAFLVPYYFVHEVIKNSIHVTIAGVVGTWWFAPEDAKGCCSSAVKDSFFRAVTSSFGSICFGSFLLAIVQALRQVANIARNSNDDNQILLCIIECILGCVEDLMEYFNKWAFIYVGLYGYGYIEAGKNVITLFKNRGYEAVIADNLVDNVLSMVAIVIGLFSGVVALLVQLSTADTWFHDAPFADVQDQNLQPTIAFVIGFVTGTMLSSIMMNVISSAVNAVIVLFMEAPAAFELHYPALSLEMREAWEEKKSLLSVQ